jgi:hexosaminidase
MARQGLGRDFAALQQYHTARALALAAAAGKAGVVWQEAAQGAGGAGALRNDTVVQVWKWAPDLGRSRGFAARDSAAAAEARRRALRWLALPAAAARNDAWPPPDAYWRRELERVLSTHRAVLSAPWYLNLAPPAEGAWAQFWRVDPLPFSTDPGQRERMLGGEACAWGELIDATNALTKTWPLAAAVAERLWVGGGGGGAREEADAGARLAGHRCRMRMRGVDAAPLRPGACPQEAGD